MKNIYRFLLLIATLSLVAPTPFVAFAQVSQFPACTLTTNKTSYNFGETINFSWTSKNATYAAWRPAIDGKDNFSMPGDKLQTSGTYSITANIEGSPYAILDVYNTYGSGYCRADVTVASKPVTPAPTCTLYANKSYYAFGELITFTWSSQNATYASWRPAIAGKDNFTMPGDKLSTSGTYVKKADVEGNPYAILDVYGLGGSGTCRSDVSVGSAQASVVSVPVNLKVVSNVVGNSAWIVASIGGSSQNANVSYWKSVISCQSGITVSGKNGENLCGKETRWDRYSMYDTTNDYTILTAGATNNSTGEASVVLALTAYDAAGNNIGGDKDGVVIPGSPKSATTNSNTTNNSNADIDPNPGSSCLMLTNDLRYRSRDAQTNGEVSSLQDYLQAKGYLNSEPTGYFGLMTFEAVKKLQSNNGISPTGFVGPLTRAKVKALTCQ